MEALKVGHMLGSKSSNWTARLHMGTVTAAILAILFSALAVGSEIDHRFFSTPFANELVIDAWDVGDAEEKMVSDMNCHVAHYCFGLNVPISSAALEHFGSSPECPTDPNFDPYELANLLFHPPRCLSQA